MAQEASERACDRCRERRVKCDKRQPTCLRCEKLGKPCPGYDKKRKFVDEGVSLRKKFQGTADRVHGAEQSPSNKPIVNIAESPSRKPSLDSSPIPTLHDSIPPTNYAGQPSSIPVTSAEGPSSKMGFAAFDVRSLSKHLPPPMQPTTSFNPIAEAMLLAEPPLNVPNIDNNDALLDELWNGGAFDPEWFNIDPIEYYGNGNNSCGFLPNVPNIVNEVDRDDVVMSTEPSTTPLSTGIGTFSESILWAPESQLYTSALLMDEREHEMAYLIRHFTESLGPWMDLFDKDRHFTQLVPLKALSDALLRNAIAAVAAKQLGRMNGVRPFKCTQTQKPSAMEIIDEDVHVDWFYKAANYYDKAIAYSRQYLHAVSGNLSLSQAPTPNTQASLSIPNSNELLVAVSIFSLYESLDDLDTGWMQHLTGLKSLLLATTADDRMPSRLEHPLTVGRKASFWNFARADYHISYVHHRYTLLDTEDLSLWHRNGLQIQPNGSIYKSADYVKGEPLLCPRLTELVSQTLLWVVLRVMNYLASEPDETPAARQMQWEQLTRQLDQWHSDLPPTFQPVAQIRRHQPAAAAAATTATTGTTNTPRTVAARLTETFFSIDVCAAGLQLYHFARILLLLHRPPSRDASAWGSRLKAYREVSGEAIKHAHEIIGIALGRPTPAIRVEMLLPLSTAGSCLEADEERYVVLELLQAIEKDTGYSTQARCAELVQEWGWNQEPQGIA